jgi:hypothetical protein
MNSNLFFQLTEVIVNKYKYIFHQLIAKKIQSNIKLKNKNCNYLLNKTFAMNLFLKLM